MKSAKNIVLHFLSTEKNLYKIKKLHETMFAEVVKKDLKARQRAVLLILHGHQTLLTSK
tara:strand:+ start:566 stop:742 length:177 start_codon:yes stop_codon:yes gene_type:complete